MTGKAIILSAITSVLANHTSCFIPEILSRLLTQRFAMGIIARTVIVLSQVLASIDQVVAIAKVGAVLPGSLFNLFAYFGVGCSTQGIVDTLLGFVEEEVHLLSLGGLWVAAFAHQHVVAAGQATDFDIAHRLGACSLGIAQDWLSALVFWCLVVLTLRVARVGCCGSGSLRRAGPVNKSG